MSGSKINISSFTRQELKENFFPSTNEANLLKHAHFLTGVKLLL